MQGHAHLSTRREDVHRSVVVEARKGAVHRRGLGEFFDLVPQCRDLVPGLLDGNRQFFIVRTTLGYLTPGFEELLLQDFDSSCGLIEVARREVAWRIRVRRSSRSLLEESLNPWEPSISPP